LGQPRIWMSMSRDGLLPEKFGKIHSRFRTPAFSTVITGLVVGIPSLFLNLTEVTDLTSIGTLFAFVIVCAGQLSHHKGTNNGSFRMPYVNAKYIVPGLYILAVIVLWLISKFSIFEYLKLDQEWEVFKHKIPYLFFFVVSTFITVRTYLKSYSLIPVLGLITNFYLMTELGYINWMRFFIWLVAGLIIYFSFGIRKSKLRNI
ncbi:MAG TPA: amino acid permease C-terminal domain-containing protein, partial [Bacteroidales bacterium]|nr:amino acid permease C-terminal domain-containing protein [Bacteroidales bacterium]